MKNIRLNIKNKGFTLIELLVVIAIIGLLSTIVIWALSSAKNKNTDAVVKEALSSIPNQAGIFYLNYGSFAGFCSSSIAKSAYPIVSNAAKNAGLSSVTVNNAGSLTTATCNNTADDWAVEVPLKNKNIGGIGKSAMFCIDSLGIRGPRSTSIGTNVICPTS